jgi:thymidylate synthase
MQMTAVRDIRQFFIDELKDEAYTIDKTGQKTIELIGASFIADESAIFGTPNYDYIQEELDWYESQSTNINDISEIPPQAWKYAANTHGEINSNYGHLVWSDKYFNQYGNVLDELLHNPDGRRASMIYNRPSIWMEYNENGKSDFICTNAVTYYIRDNILHSVVQMRSNDVVFGYKNDYAWQRHLMQRLVEDYNGLNMYDKGDHIEEGHIIWQVQNLHVYERHFHLVKE